MTADLRVERELVEEGSYIRFTSPLHPLHLRVERELVEEALRGRGEAAQDGLSHVLLDGHALRIELR